MMERKSEQQTCGVYKIENLINGKIYIGQSKHIEQRWEEHKRPSKRKNPTKRLYQAFNKYGLNNFSFEILEECSSEILLERESCYINYYNSSDKDKGYNMKKDECFRREVNEEVLDGIVEDLICTNLKRKDIAEKWNVSPSYVSNVNTGLIRYNPEYDYPLRPVQYKKNSSTFCIDCGIKISNNAQRCASCAKKKRREDSVYFQERDKLKQLIRTTPFTKIGELFGVSDNAVRHWCETCGLPTRKRDIKAYSDEEWERL